MPRVELHPPSVVRDILDGREPSITARALSEQRRRINAARPAPETQKEESK